MRRTDTRMTFIHSIHTVHSLSTVDSSIDYYGETELLIVTQLQ